MLFLLLLNLFVVAIQTQTVYWLARMIDSGEDVKFIARRMLILASEDVGIANPTALVFSQQHIPSGIFSRIS